MTSKNSLTSDFYTSKIITGLWQVADMERDGNTIDLDEAAKAMLPYIEAGFTSFDMADHYGSAELIVGKLHKKYISKEKIQLFTKWVPTPGVSSKEAVREAVHLSLKRMQLDKLDLLQFHAWNYADPTWLDQLYWLQELQQEGLILNLGLTNFDTAHVRMVLNSGIKVVSNQVCFSLLDQRAKQNMLALCAEYGTKVLAFGTVAGGFLSEKWLNMSEPVINNLATWSEMKYKRFIDQTGGWQNFQEQLKTLSEIAENRSVSIANIASAYILAQTGVGGIIIGARLGKSGHINSNVQLFGLTLTNSELLKIESALSQLESIPGDCGDEYRKPPFLTASGDLSHHLESFPAPYKTKIGNDNRTQVLSGTIWEDIAGFSRAIKKDDRILISGTTATNGKHVIGGNDPVSQTHFIIDKIEGALQSLGSSLQDVVRTRIFIRNMDDWEPIARAHGARFKDIQPTNTMVRADLIGDEYLVEIEAEAMI
jgi:aryl-alcohol dehydrogenase-like predicted oxidoreductase/enamine deaminase RidA (YjgF/YER057c/UK114 family)